MITRAYYALVLCLGLAVVQCEIILGGSTGWVPSCLNTVPSDVIYFNGSASRSYTTDTLNLNHMDNKRGTVKFFVWIAGANVSCGSPVASQNNTVVMEYSIDGENWIRLENLSYNSYQSGFTLQRAFIPDAAATNTTLYRWRQMYHNELNGENWAISRPVFGHDAFIDNSVADVVFSEDFSSDTLSKVRWSYPIVASLNARDDDTILFTDTDTHDRAPRACSGGLCESDAGCPQNKFCKLDGQACGSCTARLSDGSLCLSANYCVSGNCAEGLCCNTPCTESCKSCNVTTPGVCSAVPAGVVDPKRVCSTASPCGYNGLCDGYAACQTSSAVCQNAACQGELSLLLTVCSGTNSTCPSVGATVCPNNLTCTGAGVCPAACTSQSMCRTNFYCDIGSGKCLAKKSYQLMDTCTASFECLSGYCANGYCCNSVCNSTCYACNVTGSLGVCTAIGVTVDAFDHCPPESPCGRTGRCDGAGACAMRPSSIVCRTESCTGGMYYREGRCNGSVCDALNETCTDYNVCADPKCSYGCFFNNHCSNALDFCSEHTANELRGVNFMRGHCAPKMTSGNTTGCNYNYECLSGYCVSGYCCNSPCNGTCRSCTQPGFVGQCLLFAAGTYSPEHCPVSGVCGNNNTCAEGGVCAKKTDQCYSTPYCSGFTKRDNEFCVASSDFCPDTSAPCPNHLMCNTTTDCFEYCTTDYHCQPGYYCGTDSVCLPTLGNGATCERSSQCDSAYCVGSVGASVCCDSSCLGTCISCTVSGYLGHCHNLSISDKHPNCYASGTNCGDTGYCDGAGACAYVPIGTQCESEVCTASTLFAPKICSRYSCDVTTFTPCIDEYACVDNVCERGCLINEHCNMTTEYCPNTNFPGFRMLCTAKLANGESCWNTTGSECASGYCIDGFCCNSECVGNCRSCNQEGYRGICTFHAVGTPSSSECPPSGEGQCGATGFCGTDGNCQNKTASCGPATCSDAIYSSARYCDEASGDPACPVNLLPCPGNLRCQDTIACLSYCTSNDDCVDGYYCSESECLAKKPNNGSTCSQDYECELGFCVDGYCCDARCGAACESCGLTGTLGTCTALAAGTADPMCVRSPDPVCGQDAAADNAVCGLSGLCAADRVCANKTIGTVCGCSSCVYPAVTASKTCQIVESEFVCTTPASAPCSYCSDTLTCSATCNNNDERCFSTDYCNSSSVCAPRLAQAASCSRDRMCAAGLYCVDGVCCTSQCIGPCRGCSAAGVCEFFAVGANESQCIASGQLCGQDGYCGSSGYCRNKTDVCGIEKCTGSMFYANVTCINTNAVTCPAQTAQICPNGYVCGTTVCRINCTEQTHCQNGYYCDTDKTCKVKKSNDGSMCSNGYECSTGYCMQGYCCNVNCSSSCRLCNVTLGTCSSAPDGFVDPQCPVQSPCGRTGMCYSGSCAIRPPATVCQTSACNGTHALPYTTCGAYSGSEICPVPSYLCNGLYACESNICAKGCFYNDNCTSTQYCLTHATSTRGNCTAKLAAGASNNCSQNYQCTSGFCVDGYCCDTACNTSCKACNRIGKLGTCSPLDNNTVTYGNRANCSKSGECGYTGTCDGQGGCMLSAAVCANASCSGSSFIAVSYCNPMDTNATCPILSGSCKDNLMCDPNGKQCLTLCAAHTDCVSGYYCEPSSKKCLKLKAPGTKSPCVNGYECTNNICAQGYCCNAICNASDPASPCRACNIPGYEGTCTFQALGYGPVEECKPAVGSKCGIDGYCNGLGGCRVLDNNTVCQAKACTGGLAYYQTKCAGTNATNCPATAPTDCTGRFECAGDTCIEGCYKNEHCDALSQYCPSNDEAELTRTMCVSKIPDGHPCTKNYSCFSDKCVDGICCNDFCVGICRACNVPGYYGICTSVPQYTPELTNCPPGPYGSLCGYSGMCDGKGYCAFIDAVCQQEECHNYTHSFPSRCRETNDTDCRFTYEICPNNLMCSSDGRTCRGYCSVNSDCRDGYYCEGSTGECMLFKQPSVGHACNSSYQCSNNICVDGYCCDTVCNATCMSCGLPSSRGNCTFVPDDVAPRGVECPIQEPCGRDGKCDGAGNCRIRNSKFVCRDVTCTPHAIFETVTCTGAVGVTSCPIPMYNPRPKECQTFKGRSYCFSGKDAPRKLETTPVDVALGGRITFYALRDDANELLPGEDLQLSYSINGTAWVPFGHYYASQFSDRFAFIEEQIPAAAMSNNVRFRFRQLRPDPEMLDLVLDHKWALDDIRILLNGGPVAGQAGYAIDIGKVSRSSLTTSKNYIQFKPLMPVTQQTSIEFWVYLRSQGDVMIRMPESGIFFGLGSVSSRAAGRTLQFLVYKGAEHVDNLFAAARGDGERLPFKQWIHVGVAYDSAMKSVQMFVNNKQVEHELLDVPGDLIEFSSAAAFDSDEWLRVGAGHFEVLDGFDGIIDDLVVHNVTIPIKSTYTVPLTSRDLRYTVGCYSFDEPSTDINDVFIRDCRNLSYAPVGYPSAYTLRVPSSSPVVPTIVIRSSGSGQFIPLVGFSNVDPQNENPSMSAIITAVPVDIPAEGITESVSLTAAHVQNGQVISGGAAVLNTEIDGPQPGVIVSLVVPGTYVLKYKTRQLDGLLSVNEAEIRISGNFPMPTKQDAVVADGISTTVIVVSSVAVTLAIGGSSTAAIFYLRKQKMKREIPVVPFTPFAANDAYSEKYWQMELAEEYVVNLREIDNLFNNHAFLAVVLCRITPITEADEATKSVVYVYEAAGRAMQLIKMFIDDEIDSTVRPQTLFRGNSIASKVIKTYSFMIGKEYLHNILSAILCDYTFKAEDDAGGKIDVEVDEAKAEAQAMADIEVRKYALMMVTQKILSRICSSAAEAPTAFRDICHHIYNRVDEKWPEHSLKSVGAFVFLRFFTPAIMTPYAFGLVPSEPAPVAQRMLILVAKVLQNAANDVEFGKKESYMMKMNPFLQSNRERVNQFFLEMGMPCTATASLAEAPVSQLPAGVREMSLVNVHRHLHQNASKLIKFISENPDLARDNLPEGIDLSKYENPARVVAFFKEEIDYVLNKCGDPPLLTHTKPAAGKAVPSTTETPGNVKNVERIARRLSMVAKGNTNPYQVGRPRPRTNTESESGPASPTKPTKAGLLSVDLTPVVTGKAKLNDKNNVEMLELESKVDTVSDE